MDNRLTHRAFELAGFQPGTEDFAKLAAAARIPGLSPDLVVKAVSPHTLTPGKSCA